MVSYNWSGMTLANSKRAGQEEKSRRTDRTGGSSATKKIFINISPVGRFSESRDSHAGGRGDWLISREWIIVFEDVDALNRIWLTMGLTVDDKRLNIGTGWEVRQVRNFLSPLSPRCRGILAGRTGSACSSLLLPFGCAVSLSFSWSILPRPCRENLYQY